MLPNEKVIHPWTPVRVEKKADNAYAIDVWGRQYLYDQSLLPVSIASLETELLSSPMRLTGWANGQEIKWEEQGCFLLEPTDEQAIVNGYAQSDCLIANTTFACEYDGMASLDIKIMPRGMTVPQCFGLEPFEIKGYSLEKLWLEIPLCKSSMSLYSLWPGGEIKGLVDDAPLPENGLLLEGGIALCFKPALWFGDERIGLSIFAESDENWQPADSGNTIEILDEGSQWLLRIHLLDLTPNSWRLTDLSGVNNPCINFSLGIQATPVKPFDEDFHKINAVHIDCFTKLEGDYYPFLTGPMGENHSQGVIDRLEQAGVNLLILHEKWTKIQNYWQFATDTVSDIKKLVELCHSRGIRVIPYFGYELSSHAPQWNEKMNEIIRLTPDGHPYTGWYRVPWQRDIMACYRSGWGDQLAQGIIDTIEKFNFDGVYLDSTTRPMACANTAHGCGYTDTHGQLHATYPIYSVRDLMKKMYHYIHPRRGIINPHTSGCNLMATAAFSHAVWDGEHIQTAIHKKGLSQFSLEYFRAEYLGRNFGVPVQFIVYEHRPDWTFEKALSLCLIHGVYPRPNSVDHPLDVMEKIWKIIHSYGIWDTAWHPYWENAAYIVSSDPNAKVSFYKKDNPDASVRLLVYIANPTNKIIDSVQIQFFPEAFKRVFIKAAYDMQQKTDMPIEDNSIVINLGDFDIKILYVTI
ncbi:MAG: DUF6259 domain-containing protein [Bacillota bacterium]|nr:DUF6259 domain-containing protein [Bacillota bacterium]